MRRLKTQFIDIAYTMSTCKKTRNPSSDICRFSCAILPSTYVYKLRFHRVNGQQAFPRETAKFDLSENQNPLPGYYVREIYPHINVCKNQFNAASIESEAAVELIFATVQPVKRDF